MSISCHDAFLFCLLSTLYCRPNRTCRVARSRQGTRPPPLGQKRSRRRQKQHSKCTRRQNTQRASPSTPHPRPTYVSKLFPAFVLVEQASLSHTHPSLGSYQTKGPGVTGNVYDAVTQLRAKVEETTDAAVTEGQKTVQAATNAGANYLGQARNLASSAISTAAVCLSISPR